MLWPQIDNLLDLLFIFKLLITYYFYSFIFINIQYQILIIQIVVFNPFKLSLRPNVFIVTECHVLFKLAHEFNIIERMDLKFS